MTANKRFTSEDNCCGYYTEIIDNEKELDLSLYNPKKNLIIEELVDLLNELNEENEELKQQRIDLLRLIDNNIEIYENINTNVEFHKGEIQGKLTLLYNLRELILK